MWISILSPLTFQLFWSMPNADCGYEKRIVNTHKNHPIQLNPTTYRIEHSVNTHPFFPGQILNLQEMQLLAYSTPLIPCHVSVFRARLPEDLLGE